MQPAHTVTQTIARNWVDLYETIWKPDFFPQWAAGLSEGPLEQDGERWKASGPNGDVYIRFTDHNPFGVMDHFVNTGSGSEIYVPMRIIANEQGAEVQLTLFRDGLTSESRFAEDIAAVERDLQTLNQLMTG